MSRADVPETDASSEDNGGEQFQPRRCDCNHCRSQGRYPAGPDCLFGP